MSIFGQLPDVSVHFSRSIGLPVINSFGKKIGTIIDYFVLLLLFIIGKCDQHIKYIIESL